MLRLCPADSCLGFSKQGAPRPPSGGPWEGRDLPLPVQAAVCVSGVGATSPEEGKAGGLIAAPTAADPRVQKIWRPLVLGKDEGSFSVALPCLRLTLPSESFCGGEGLLAQMCPPVLLHPTQLPVVWAPTTQFRALRGKRKGLGGGAQRPLLPAPC